MRVALARLLLAGAVISSSAPALGSTGVAIDVSRIEVDEELLPGNEYRLPTFGVHNPGTDRTSYRLTVSFIDGQQARRPPEAWFRFSPTELEVAPGASRPVQTLLDLPPDAEAGAYTALIGPQIVVSGGGTQVGAAAAARLSFRVAPCQVLECWLRWSWRWMAANPWSLILSAGLLALAVAIVLRRRFTFSVARR